MRKKFSVGIALVLGLVFSMSACDNEVDINADWKEILVVYGLLDPLDSVQYIKINKAFLNENENALKVAQNPDSLFIKDAKVTLLHINSGTIIDLERVNEIQKDPGIFAQNPNYLYKTTVPILENEPYKLTVESKLTGQKVEAVTWTLRKARIEAPFKSSNPTFSLGAKFIVISYVPGWNSYAYDIKMRVKIDEYNRQDTGFLRTRDLTWNVITNYVVQRNTTAAVLHQIERESFMQFLASSLDTSRNIVRRFKHVSVEYYGGSQNLIDYISVNEPSIGIVQKTAEYSNIEGGMGLFGSRCRQEIGTSNFEPASVGILQNNKLTAPLNFIR
jgi:hypothetical protein